MACGGDLPGWPYWLLEGEGHGSAEQFERALLDGRGAGGFLNSLPAEVDDLPVEGGEVVEEVEEVAVFADGQLAAVAFAGVFVPGVL